MVEVKADFPAVFICHYAGVSEKSHFPAVLIRKSPPSTHSTGGCKDDLSIIFTYIPCILILSKFFIHQLMHKRTVLKTILKFTLKLTFSLLPHSTTYTHQQGPTNICSPITTHRCILIGYFNNCNFSKHE
jgi:hypothetical protein